jgi:threonine/homoserine/homoserine lactone efflux protein
MLSQVIGDLLPSAIAVALSPIPIIAVVLVLGSPRARSSGPAFAVGWVAGLLVVTVAVLALAGGADESGSEASAAVDWLKLVVGIAFLLMAAKQWKQRPREGSEPELPRWMARIGSVTPAKALRVGATLSAANPKNLALTVVAAAAIAEAGLDRADMAVAVGVFVGLGSLSVAGAVLAYLVAADRATGPLTAIREFMTAHNAVIMMVILLLLGAKLVGDGIAALTG